MPRALPSAPSALALAVALALAAPAAAADPAQGPDPAAASLRTCTQWACAGRSGSPLAGAAAFAAAAAACAGLGRRRGTRPR